jgi:diguanylate cyclase (GGDEF)-like protein
VRLVAVGRDMTGSLDLTAALAEANQNLEGALMQLEKAHADLAARTSELSVANERLQALQIALQEQAVRDSLTGLFNRRYLAASLGREAARADRSGSPVGVMMIDLDHFKQINDRYGHLIGDATLQAVGRMLQSGIRADDIACRYGGEEFVVVIPGAGTAVMLRRAEMICAATAALQIPLPEGTLEGITVSIGVAVYPSHGSTMDEVLARADMALYGAKQAGRNRVVLAEPAGATAP